MNKKYKGIIIEESLENKDFLKEIKIIKTTSEPVTEKHRTPWVKQWTTYAVEIPENKAADIAEKISKALDSKHNWYADFKNEEIDFIIFRDKVFKISRISKEQYDEATRYGISIGIPNYQLDFSPHIKKWKR